MHTESATTLPAQTIVELTNQLIDLDVVSEGARITFVARMADGAIRRGLDPHAPIDGDVLDEISMDFTWPGC